MRRSALALVCLALLASCASSRQQASSASGAPTPTVAGDAQSDGEVRVFAAASLTDAFGDIAAAFEEANPATTVTLNLAGSQQLAGQIVEGAPADVFASADTTQMGRVTDAGLVVAEPVVFVKNTLAIAVEPGNPEDVTGLADLARDDLVVVLAAEGVPAGNFARQALDGAGVSVTPASLEIDVRSVLAKVELGEADVGIVYSSDVVAAGDGVAGIAIPDDQNLVASYPVVPLEAAPNPELAAAFVEFLESAGAQRILTQFGFVAL